MSKCRDNASFMIALACSAVAISIHAADASAETYNGSASGTWSTGAGWNSVPASGVATHLTYDVGLLPAATPATFSSTNDLTAFQLNQLTLAGSGPATSGLVVVTIGGNALQFVANGVTGPVITNNALRGNGTSNTYNSGLRYNLSTQLTLSTDLTITGNGTSLLELSGSMSGSGSITKSGTSGLVLSGVNGRYTGNLNILGGVVRPIGANNQFSAWVTSGSLNIAAGASLDPTTTGGPNAGNVAVANLTGAGSISGARTLAINYSGGTTSTFNGTAIGTANLVKNGAGTTEFTNVLAQTGNTAITVNAGTFITPGATAGTGTTGLAINGHGVLKLTGNSGLVGARGITSLNGAGTLWIAPSGSGAAVEVTGGLGNTANATFRPGGGTILLDRGNNTSVAYTFGNAGSAAIPLARSGGNGSLVIKAANGIGQLGMSEKFRIATSSASSVPASTNGIVVPWLIGQDTDANLSGDFLTYSGTGAVTDVGFTKAAYSVATDLNASTAATVYDANSTGNGTNINALTGNASAYALNTRGQTINLGSNTLTMGTSPAANDSGYGGVIMNGGSINGGVMDFDANEADFYVSAANGTISSQLKLLHKVTSPAQPTMVLHGPGVLALTHPNNLDVDTHEAGPITIMGGATLDVRLSQKTNTLGEGGTGPRVVQSLSGLTGALSMRGGVLQVDVDNSDTNTFTRPIGQSSAGSAGNVHLSGGPGGGFAARNGTLLVNIGGSVTPTQMIWGNGTGGSGTASFLPDGATLYFGSATADSMVDWTNPLDLGGTAFNYTRMIRVVDNPNSSSDIAKISGVISSIGPNNGIGKEGSGVLTLSASNTYTGVTAVAAGKLVVSGSHDSVHSGYLISGGTLEVSGSISPTAAPAPVAVTGAGTLSVTGAGTVSASTLNSVTPIANDGQLTVIAGGTIGSLSGVGTLSISGGTLNTADIQQGSLAISGTGTVRVAGGSSVSEIASLSMSGAGKLDLTDNDLNIASADPAVIRSLIIAGRNGGTWDGASGITSSAAAVTPAYGLGYSATTVGAPVTVSYVLLGDANLDGSVDSSDFGILAGNWLGTDEIWQTADFNYDNLVDSGDFGILAGNWNSSVPLSVVAAQFNFDIAAVPEPSVAGLLGVAGLIALRRRRRDQLATLN